MLWFIFLIPNMSLPTNVSSLSGLLSYSNNAVNGLFGAGILFALFAIVLIGTMLKGFEVEAGLTVASVLSLLIGLMMLLMSPPLVPAALPMVFAGLSIIGIVLLLVKGGSGVY